MGDGDIFLSGIGSGAVRFSSPEVGSVVTSGAANPFLRVDGARMGVSPDK